MGIGVEPFLHWESGIFIIYFIYFFVGFAHGD